MDERRRGPIGKRWLSKRVRELLSFVLILTGVSKLQADKLDLVTFKPQINITTTPPQGAAYCPFYLWWSTPGDVTWPNYVFYDVYDSIDTEPRQYPGEDANIYYIAASQISNPSPNATGQAPVPQVNVNKWAAGKNYAIGDKVTPSNNDAAHAYNGHMYVCTKAGTSPNGEPVWSSEIGATVPNAPVEWKEHTPVAVVGVSGQWSPDASHPATLVAGAPAPVNSHAVTYDYALEKRFVPMKDRQFDVWIELTNSQPNPSEVRIVYALFRKSDPDASLVTPIPWQDPSGTEHVFRTLRHGTTGRYIVGTTPEDHPYVVRDLRVDLSGVPQTDYVYLDVFVFDLKNRVDHPFGWGGAMKRMQVQP